MCYLTYDIVALLGQNKYAANAVTGHNAVERLQKVKHIVLPHLKHEQTILDHHQGRLQQTTEVQQREIVADYVTTRAEQKVYLIVMFNFERGHFPRVQIGVNKLVGQASDIEFLLDEDAIIGRCKVRWNYIV